MVSAQFSQALHALEQDIEELRIKKLLYYVCYRDWPSLSLPMAQMELSQMVPKLLKQVQNAEDLSKLLLRKAARLNKSEVYLPLAQNISQILGPLCTPVTALSETSAPPPVTQEQTAGASVPASTQAKTYTIFDLKMALMQSINPLKAKILLFSLLYHPFSFSQQDWLDLKQQPLGHLLQQLLETYPTSKALEQQLVQAADHINALDQGPQMVQALLRAVRPIYANPISSGYFDLETAPDPRPLQMASI